MTVKTYEWMRDHGMSDESISEGLHHASRFFRGQWIKENSTRKVFKRDRGVQHIKESQRALDRSSSNQNEKKNIRDADLENDTKLSPLYWVFYVHFGI